MGCCRDEMLLKQPEDENEKLSLCLVTTEGCLGVPLRLLRSVGIRRASHENCAD